MNKEEIALFALNASQKFGDKVSQYLELPLSEHEERQFEDGEHKARPLINVRGKDCYVIQSLYSDNNESVNDKLCKLLFFIGALKDASAGSIAAIVPYMAYARKDRQTQTRDPVTSRYMALLLESVGVDRVVTLDIHNLAAFQNAFRCHTDHLEARQLFIDYLSGHTSTNENFTVVSPDIGGVKRAEKFRQTLARRFGKDVGLAYMEKARAKGITRLGRLTGEVKDNTVIIVDDLISTGGTLLHAARACKDQGANKIYAAASHGVFVTGANKLLEAEELEKVIMTDTIPPFRLEQELIDKKLVIVPATELFAEAIKCLHTKGSIVNLLGN